MKPLLSAIATALILFSAQGVAELIGNVKTNPSLTAATCFCEFNLIATGTRKRSIPRSNDAINPIFLYLLSWIFIHPNKACMPYPFYDV